MVGKYTQSFHGSYGRDADVIWENRPSQPKKKTHIANFLLPKMSVKQVQLACFSGIVRDKQRLCTCVSQYQSTLLQVPYSIVSQLESLNS